MAPEPGIWGRARMGSGFWPKTQGDFLCMSPLSSQGQLGSVGMTQCQLGPKTGQLLQQLTPPGKDSPPSGNRDGGIFCIDVNSGSEGQPAFSGHAGEAAKNSGASLGFGVSHLACTRALLHTSGKAQGSVPLTSVSGFLICKLGIVLTL